MYVLMIVITVFVSAGMLHAARPGAVDATELPISIG